MSCLFTFKLDTHPIALKYARNPFRAPLASTVEVAAWVLEVQNAAIETSTGGIAAACAEGMHAYKDVQVLYAGFMRAYEKRGGDARSGSSGGCGRGGGGSEA